ncbi:tRNA (guanine37-N1)-methyltransferase [Mariprofundus micogutta]|uniref:tRNA (Guanine37-N1)-methyltransferase n=1 Tax=Mariprofundus micogutta TaxID=1921010 RepID=A0A1L8CQQ0_9PROT|nr:RNA methyltransferase [Mariprofundus micogutta]GAV21204.1 tRNA (guanine37-N1)-methyltransferase [Mariprofundus micogutta]
MFDSSSRIAVALVHHPVLNRGGDTTTTAITSIDVHDFARSCAFYDVSPVYLVHPADGMHALIHDMTDYYLNGKGGERNPARKEVLSAIRCVKSIDQILDEDDYQLWYTSATPPDESCINPSELKNINGKHLIVLGTGWGLDEKNMPDANGWLSPIEGVGKVRHLSVRAALAIYLDRLAI